MDLMLPILPHLGRGGNAFSSGSGAVSFIDTFRAEHPRVKSHGFALIWPLLAANQAPTEGATRAELESTRDSGERRYSHGTAAGSGAGQRWLDQGRK
jgi:hypothetical protein